MHEDKTTHGSRQEPASHTPEIDDLPEAADQLLHLLAVAVGWHDQPDFIGQVDVTGDEMREMALRCLAATVLRHEERLDNGELMDKFLGAFINGTMGLKLDEHADEVLEGARRRGVELVRRIEALEAKAGLR